MANFQNFVENRRLLQEFCQLHYASVAHFSEGLSFVNVWKDGRRGRKKRTVEHLTSTATCFESLLEYPGIENIFRPLDVSSVMPEYADAALRLRQKDWVSDGSAGTYCRCRALPFVVRHVSDWHSKIESHLEAIFRQMVAIPTRFAIGEAGWPLKKRNWYPPNAFHTYWALELLSALAIKFPTQYGQLDRKLHLSEFSDKMRIWARETLGCQVSLHSAHSSVLDSDQLAWSLAVTLRSPENAEANLAEQDLIKHAVHCLFETQTEVGTWRHYAPLFHYRDSGNAYCYVFESFAELLRWSLEPRARFVRNVLKAHFDNLLRLWQYARSTQVAFDSSPSPKRVGWSSGHRTGSPEPESWATASVFVFSQYFRRLVGVWAREEALSALPKRSTYPSVAKAREKLASRTRTWTSGNHLQRFLTAHFAKYKSPGVDGSRIDPDEQPVGEDDYRAAILYGPPGTGKTTIARALAGMIGWEYVELHASHFVADGLPYVQRTADEIFKRLMELDHAVVLFDEIDELVREREGEEADAFGRFLTTSMLPKLAELWKSRKLLYFVATNHIRLFDRAITRSGRFDTSVFVSPPSFGSKMRELQKLLKKRGVLARPGVTKPEIERAMIHPESTTNGKDLADKEIPDGNMLGKFALLRWDEIRDLAALLANDTVKRKARILDAAELARALRTFRRTQRDFFEFDRDKKFEGGVISRYTARHQE